MNCSQITGRLEQLFPQEVPEQVARMSLLILNRTVDRNRLETDAGLTDAWNTARAALDAVADQHDAVTEELELLCSGDAPIRFHPDQVWTLLRAIKVQSQMLEFYLASGAHTSSSAE